MPDYQEWSPVPALADWVECGWLMQADGPVVARGIPPDGCLDVIYYRGRDLRVVGTMSREQRFDYPPGACLAGIRFRPGMAGAILGVSPAEFTDTSVPLADVWATGRARELTDRLHDAASIQDALRLLMGSLPKINSTPNPVQQAIAAITAANGCVLDLADIARQAKLSPRQFRRRCLEESGLSPKLLCRVLRFRHVSRLAQATGEVDWPAVALEAGYFDQAHLIRDFRAFTGSTPVAVLSNTARQPSPRIAL